MTTDQLRELEKRLSEAKGGHDDDAIIERRAINALIHDNLMPEPKVVVPLNYAGSVDDAIALVERVLPDWLGITVGARAGRDGPWAQLVRNPASYSSPEITVRNAASPALALCLAAIRAIAGSAAE